ncbi:MAG: hypothetical protein K2H45_12950 [Acetatifactor sp.]|nr:hypothetical protein [Acetatifactor sp.]
MDNSFSSIPVKVISSGRSLDEVLTAYMEFHGKASQIAAASGKAEDEIFAEAMQGAVYRLYLLGVEDGMRAKDHT